MSKLEKLKYSNVKRMIRQATDREKKFAKDTSDQELLSKIHRELNNKKMNNLINGQNMGTDTKEDIQTTNKHMKRCSVSYVIRELQIKTTMRYHCTPVRTAKTPNTVTKCW